VPPSRPQERAILSIADCGIPARTDIQGDMAEHHPTEPARSCV
jgi:hypothetical protein